MTCRNVKLGDGVTAIACSREPRPAPCSMPGCGRAHERLCDYPVTRRGKKGTCSAKLCPAHTATLEDGGETLDLCPAHVAHLAKLLEPKLPTVINRHHFQWEPGFGPEPSERPNPDKRPPLPTPRIYIGRGTPLGNPYTKPEHGPIALRMYRRWLFDRIRANDRAVLDELATITPAHHLVCSCAPRACHGDVVVKAWAWAAEAGLLQPSG